MPADINNIIELGFILLNFLIFILDYKFLGRKLMHPAVLFSFIWTGVQLLHLVAKLTFLDQLFDLRIQTMAILLAGNFVFSLGAIIVAIFNEKEMPYRTVHSEIPYWQKTINPAIQWVLLFIVLLGLPYFIYVNYKIFIASNIENFFVGIRTEISYGDMSLGVEKYLASLSYFNLALQQYCYYKKRNSANRVFFILSLLLAVTYAVFTTGRGPLLWILIILGAMNFLYGKRFSLRKIILGAVIFVILFAVIGVIFGKGGNTENSLSENIKTSSEVTGTYVVASLNALDLRTEERQHPNYTGENTLRFFLAVGSALGIVNADKVPDIVQEFVFVPYSTNVYTIYDPYIADFGILYAILMVGLFGVIHTIIYYMAIWKKDIRYSLYFSITLYPLFMSFFQDMYLSLTSTWLQFIIYVELIIFINRILPAKHD